MRNERLGIGYERLETSYERLKRRHERLKRRHDWLETRLERPKMRYSFANSAFWRTSLANGAFWHSSPPPHSPPPPPRSSDFFRETSRFQELNVLTLGGCSDVDELRHTLSSLRRVCVTEPMRVPKQHLEKTNLCKLQELTSAIQVLADKKSQIQALLQREDYSSSLDLIRACKDIVAEHDLRALDCLQVSWGQSARFGK